MPQYPSVIDLGSLDGANGFQISGEAAFDTSGLVVASAGDVNGDGFADVFIAADAADPNGLSSGASYVVFGKALGFVANLNLSTLDGLNGFQINGEAYGDRSGRSIAGAGDVNGDGFDDLVIGAYFADPNGSNSGASYVVFGSPGGFPANFELSALDGSNGFQINGEAAGEASGRTVAAAGDVNGDGLDDVIIAADLAGPNGSSSGASYVVFARSGGFPANIELSSLDGSNGFQINGETNYDSSARSVASAGDVNGDGFDDIIIGAYRADPNGDYSGASYVVFGQTGGFAAQLELSALDGSNGFKINGVAAEDRSGRSVASAGDINGDGFADLIIGAPNADPNGGESGASYVVFGKAGGFAPDIELSALDGTNGFKVNGEAASDRSGTSVASAGDVNGDGFDDIIVGAYFADVNGSNSGASYVVFGKPDGFAASIELSALDGTDGFQVSGEVAADRVGVSVATAGDVNGDGLDDLIVGAFGASPNGTDSGASYVVFGRLPDAAVVRVGTAIDQNLVGGNFADFLYGLGGADNLYGNGGNDFLAGGDGNDILRGAGGNDVLVGGSGRDTLIGSTGTDRFDFNATNESGRGALRDVISDFRRGDKIDLATIDAETGAGNQRFDFIGGDRFSREKGELRVIEQAGARCLVQADTNGDGRPDLEILVLGVETLRASDFAL